MDVRVPLRNSELICIVSECDADRVLKHPWSACKWRNCWYAASKVGVMHRFVLNVFDPEVRIDHVNRSGLDNRRCNLRFCTESQNQANARSRRGSASRFKGVNRNQARWQARVRHHGRRYFAGSYATELQAALAYDRLAKQLHGAFARLNFPECNEQKIGRVAESPVGN